MRSASLACALFATAAAAAPPTTAAPTSTATLQVRASGLRNHVGQAIVAVYATEKSWNRLDQAVAVVVVDLAKARFDDPAVLAVEVAGVPPGRHAVAVIHDENGNGALDMAWLPFPHPAEGAGVSRDAPAALGPPRFVDAAFVAVAGPQPVPLRLRY